MRKPLLTALIVGALGAAPTSPVALAHRGQSRSPAALTARACHDHAGKVEGDGEYSDGAIQSARGVTCRRALSLVKPRYHWIYAHWHRAYHDGFRIARFRCHMKLYGPDYLKICVSGRRRFTFV
jgi:hypothetical protein